MQDIILKRTPDGPSVTGLVGPRRISHSPTGYEWGYGGDGPADLALNILLELHGGEQFAQRYHQAFKWDVISLVPREGGTISFEMVWLWSTEREVGAEAMAEIFKEAEARIRDCVGNDTSPPAADGVFKNQILEAVTNWVLRRYLLNVAKNESLVTKVIRIILYKIHVCLAIAAFRTFRIGLRKDYGEWELSEDKFHFVALHEPHIYGSFITMCLASLEPDDPVADQMLDLVEGAAKALDGSFVDGEWNLPRLRGVQIIPDEWNAPRESV